jgi:hypothetical protein
MLEGCQIELTLSLAVCMWTEASATDKRATIDPTLFGVIVSKARFTSYEELAAHKAGNANE